MERQSRLGVVDDLASRRPDVDGPTDRGEPEPGAAGPSGVGGSRGDRSGLSGDRRSPGMSCVRPGALDEGRRDALPGGNLASRAAVAGAGMRRRSARRLAVDPGPRTGARGITMSPGTSQSTSLRSCSGSTRWPGGSARRTWRPATPFAMPWLPTCSAMSALTAERWRGWRCGPSVGRPPTAWPWPGLRMFAVASMP